MKALPFLINNDSSGNRLSPIDRSAPIYNEAWLQELLRQHPNILPVSEIESVYSPLAPIGREVSADAGTIDNLFISHRGYLVLVETKLWHNPEAKREVLAQAIDYNSAISKWSFDDVDQVVRAYTRKYETDEVGLAKWVESQFGPLEEGHDYFENIVAKNLRLGRFLTLIVGDNIRQSLVDMMNYVNKYPHLAMDVALVELKCYQWDRKHEWPLLVVPNIVSRTEIVERSVVQVTIEPETPHVLDVRQDKIPKTATRTKRVSLTEEDYWELLQSQAPDNYRIAKDLIEYYKTRDQNIVQPKESSIAVYLTLPESGQRISLFFIRTDGVIECWRQTIGEQLVKAGLSTTLLDSLVQDLTPILRNHTKKLSMNFPAKKVDQQAFINAIEKFIESILRAEASI